MFPRARREHLTLCELPDELLIYDHERQTAHCLNSTAALVWRHCDGQTSLAELARTVARELGVADAAELVALALEKLGRRHLLVEVPSSAPERRLGRREALSRLALGAAVLPLVMTVATKASAEFLSEEESSSDSSPSRPVNIGVSLSVVTGGSGGSPKPSAPSGPCRTKGQSCLAAASGQQGTCCAGLTCTGLAQGAGVCA